MKQLLIKWRRPLLFTAVGALAGLAYSGFVHRQLRHYRQPGAYHDLYRPHRLAAFRCVWQGV